MEVGGPQEKITAGEVCVEQPAQDTLEAFNDYELNFKVKKKL